MRLREIDDPVGRCGASAGIERKRHTLTGESEAPGIVCLACPVGSAVVVHKTPLFERIQVGMQGPLAQMERAGQFPYGGRAFADREKDRDAPDGERLRELGRLREIDGPVDSA